MWITICHAKEDVCCRVLQRVWRGCSARHRVKAIKMKAQYKWDVAMESRKDVLQLTASNFERTLRRRPWVLVRFTAEFCEECEACQTQRRALTEAAILLRMWSKRKDMLWSRTIRCAELDALSHVDGESGASKLSGHDVASEWVQEYDAWRGVTYWKNVWTGDTAWEMPSESLLVTPRGESRRSSIGHKYGVTSFPAPMHLFWLGESKGDAVRGIRSKVSDFEGVYDTIGGV